MERIKKKFIVGFVFAIAASIVSVLIKYNENLWELIKFNVEAIGLNFVIFFLVGYVLLGNLFVIKK